MVWTCEVVLLCLFFFFVDSLGFGNGLDDVHRNIFLLILRYGWDAKSFETGYVINLTEENPKMSEFNKQAENFNSTNRQRILIQQTGRWVSSTNRQRILIWLE